MSAKSFTGEIFISAPRARVWDALLNADSFAKWSSVFEGGITPDGEWTEGGKVRFRNADGDGVVAEVLRLRETENVEWKYVGVLADGRENDSDDEGWLGLCESFSLSESDGGTALSVRSQCPESYREYFSQKWPRALAALKELAEKA